MKENRLSAFLEKNLSALRQNLPRQSAAQADFIDRLTQISPAEINRDVLLYETDAGDFTLAIPYQASKESDLQELCLHHPGGAQQEARQICSADQDLLHPGPRANHLLLGLGLGYLLQEVFERSEGRIFIYEPNLPLLRFVLENVDLSEYLASPRVYLAGDTMLLFQQVRSRYISGEPLDVLLTNGYAVLLADQIPGLMKKLLSTTEDQSGNIAVGLRLHKNWVEHP